MNWEEWKDWYKDSIREWKEGYKKAMEEWKEKMGDWKDSTRTSVSGGVLPPMPPMPQVPVPLPQVPVVHFGPAVRSNVVASRIGDEDLTLIDMLVEAGLFNTRSEAVAYLVNVGIQARRDIFDKVSSALEEIRRARKEAEDHVAKLKREVGIAEPKETEVATESEKTCTKCHKSLSNLPKDIAMCPYCGSKLEKG